MMELRGKTMHRQIQEYCTFLFETPCAYTHGGNENYRAELFRPVSTDLQVYRNPSSKLQHLCVHLGVGDVLAELGLEGLELFWVVAAHESVVHVYPEQDVDLVAFAGVQTGVNRAAFES